jgi:hypothetical protein
VILQQCPSTDGESRLGKKKEPKKILVDVLKYAYMPIDGPPRHEFSDLLII